MNFDEHVTKLWKKASQKIHALAGISNYMSQDKLPILMKAFIESQFGYCPLVWMYRSRTLNNRVNRLHERAFRLIYTDPSLTFDKLLRKDNSFQVHHRNLQILATEMYKAKNNLSPTRIKKVCKDRENPDNLRNANPFQSTNVNTVHNGINTVAFQGPKIWAIVPEEIKKVWISCSI